MIFLTRTAGKLPTRGVAAVDNRISCLREGLANQARQIIRDVIMRPYPHCNRRGTSSGPPVAGSRQVTCPLNSPTTSFERTGKGTGNIWLHMRTHLLIKTNVSFSISRYLRNITGRFSFPGSKAFEIDGIEVTPAVAAKYDGRIQVHELKLTVPTDLRDLKPCVANFSIACHFDFHGAEIFEHHVHPVFVRRMYRPL